MSRLSGQIALVTGGGRGIGRAVARRLAREGAHVVVNYVSGEGAARETVEAIRADGGTADTAGFDVADAAAVKAGVDGVLGNHGRIDILVNNAGVVHNGLLMRLKDDDIEHVLGVNLRGTIHCTRAVTAGMVKRRQGRIVNMTSVVAATGNAGQSIYAASKAGVVGFTRATARELAPRSITVNAVAPGFIDTDMTASLPDATRQDIVESIPLGRSGTAEEVAGAVLFFCLPESAYITGHVLDVNGGMHM